MTPEQAAYTRLEAAIPCPADHAGESLIEYETMTFSIGCAHFDHRDTLVFLVEADATSAARTTTAHASSCAWQPTTSPAAARHTKGTPA